MKDFNLKLETQNEHQGESFSLVRSMFANFQVLI